MFNYFKFSYYHKIDTSYFTSLFPIKKLFIYKYSPFLFFFLLNKRPVEFRITKKKQKKYFLESKARVVSVKEGRKGRETGRQRPADSRRVSHVGRENSPVRRRAFGTGTASWYAYTTMLLFDVSVRRETRIHLFLSLSFMSTRKGLLYMCALMSTPGGSPCPTLVLFNHAALPGCRQACC